jgi:HK97 family phage major capsid protein
MNWRELIKKAREAIDAGNLEEANKLTEQVKALKALEDLEPQEPENTDELDAVKKERDELKALVNAPGGKRGGNLTVTEDEDEKAIKRNPWKSYGEFLMAVKQSADGVVDERLRAIRSNDQADEGGFSLAKAMGEDFVGSLPAAKAGIKSFKAAPTGLGESMPQYGGVLVGSDRMTSVLSRVYEIGQVLSRIPMDTIGPNSNGMTYYAEAETSRATGSRRGGVRFYWMAENSAVTTSRPKFRELDLKLKKAAAAVYVTEEQLQDTAALESYVMRVMPEEIRWGVEDAILNGTGVGQPLGILNSNAVISVAKETGQDADTIVAENIINMYGRMWIPGRRNGIWLVSQDVEPKLLQMYLATGTSGQLVYMPPGGLSAAPYGTLIGRPVVVHESCDNLGDAGDILFIDPGEYQGIEKGGIQSASSIHVRFLEGESVFRFIYRVDGQPVWDSALTPANGGATVSPFVSLAERA